MSIETKTHELLPKPRYIEAKTGEDKIFVSIKIGNQQAGGTAIYENDKQIAKGNLSNKTYLGEASDLEGKDMDAATAVVDINPRTNMCVISTVFTNQNNDVLFSATDNGEAPQNGVAVFRGLYKVKLLVLLFMCFISMHNVFAQNDATEINFDNLKTPVSPGFVLLDETPESIAKPSTPQGFAVNFIGLLQGTGAAIEFAPYWWTTHENLSARSLYEERMPILSTLSVSGATVKKDSVTYVSGGIRSRIFQYYSDKSKLKAALDSIDAGAADFADALIRNNKPDQEAALKKIEMWRKKFGEFYGSPIFSVDFAAAIAGGSDTNSYKHIQYNKFATWLSFNYQVEDKISATFLTRYLTNEKLKDFSEDSDLMDFGLRGNYDITDRFCVSAEYLQRFNIANSGGTENRFAAILSYKVADNIYASGTFGKNFDNNDNIIALGGLSFGISQEKQQIK